MSIEARNSIFEIEVPADRFADIITAVNSQNLTGPELLALVPKRRWAIATDVLNIRNESGAIIGQLSATDGSQPILKEDGGRLQLASGGWVSADYMTDTEAPEGVGGSESDLTTEALIAYLAGELGIDANEIGIVPPPPSKRDILIAKVGDRVVATVVVDGETYKVTLLLTSGEITKMQEELKTEQEASAEAAEMGASQELPKWSQGFDTELKVSSGEFVFNDAEGQKYLLDQIIKVLAKQQGITEDELRTQLDASNGKTTLRTLINTKPANMELIIYPPTLKEGETVPLDLSKVIIQSSNTPPRQGFTMELATDATGGGVPSWIHADVSSEGHLVVNFFSTALEAFSGDLSIDSLLKNKKVISMMNLYPELTIEQVRESLLRQEGDSLTMVLLSLFEAYANLDSLPPGGEVWTNARPGGQYLIDLTWGGRDNQTNRTPQFPTVDRAGMNRKDPRFPDFNLPIWSVFDFIPD